MVDYELPMDHWKRSWTWLGYAGLQKERHNQSPFVEYNIINTVSSVTYLTFFLFIYTLQY